MENVKNFLVSTADFAMYYDDILACTGTANLNTSLEVTMQEQNVNAGKGNKLLYSFKFGRELNVTLEAADWKLEYIASQVGSPITEGLKDVYVLAKCIPITEGVGVLPLTPVGDVAVELTNGLIITVTPDGNTINLEKQGITNETVKVTYMYNRITKRINIDAETTPNVYKLVLDADKHNNKIGKVGTVQVVIPSYQPSGNFTVNFTPDGVTSTNIDGKALAVEGETCDDGSGLYAYIDEFDDTSKVMDITDLAATPGSIELDSTNTDKTETISVIGLKGVLYSPIQLDNTDCVFVCDTPSVATVDENGIVTAVSTGTAKITVTYNKVSDEIDVTVA